MIVAYQGKINRTKAHTARMPLHLFLYQSHDKVFYTIADIHVGITHQHHCHHHHYCLTSLRRLMLTLLICLISSSILWFELFTERSSDLRRMFILTISIYGYICFYIVSFIFFISLLILRLISPRREVAIWEYF